AAAVRRVVAGAGRARAGRGQMKKATTEDTEDTEKEQRGPGATRCAVARTNSVARPTCLQTALAAARLLPQRLDQLLPRRPHLVKHLAHLARVGLGPQAAQQRHRVR